MVAIRRNGEHSVWLSAVILRCLHRTSLLWFVVLAACSAGAGDETGFLEANKQPIEDVKTPFDDALECLRPHVNPQVTFGVGNVSDHTGRESYSDGGAGKFVSQGASEMVQSALFRAGVTIINRRDVAIPVEEARWAIRNLSTQRPVMQYVSGSINGLDFIPGGGMSALLNGVGPRYRQSRILISLDLYLTDAATGTVVANVPLQKQLFAKEIGFSAGKFFGPTLVSLDAGGQDREALNFALRQMLSLATFELLAQRMNPKNYLPCRAKIEAVDGIVADTGTGKTAKLVYSELERLRETDPRAALILERELAGESIEDIMRDLGEPLPEKAQPAASPSPPPQPERKQVAVAAKPTVGAERAAVEEPKVSAEAAAEMNNDPSNDAPRVVIQSLDDSTRILISKEASVPVRWGFNDGDLVVLALAKQPFSLPDFPLPEPSGRVEKMEAASQDNLRLLRIELGCECGAIARVSNETELVLDIRTDAPQPELKTAEVNPDPEADGYGKTLHDRSIAQSRSSQQSFVAASAGASNERVETTKVATRNPRSLRAIWLSQTLMNTGNTYR